MAAIKQISTTSPVGRDTPRGDGALKVTGKAQYTSDFHFPGTLYAVPVEATIANGRMRQVDTTAAEKMPGVRAIFHRENIGQIFRSTLEPGMEGICEERRPAFADDIVRYYGQYVALAVAETFETAKAAADAVRVTYEKEKPNVATELEPEDDPEVIRATFGPHERLQSQRGDADAAFGRAAVKIDHTYVTPAETQNPIELHATTAMWNGATLTLYDSTQGVVNFRSVLAQMFGLPKENVRVITKFVGSGFGGKLFPWTHCALAAAAARQLGRPVKIAAAALVIGSAFALHVGQAQQVGARRIDLQRHDLSVSGREVVQTIVELAPGTTAPRHTHPGEEIIYVLEGTWEYTVEGKPPITVKAGEVLFIPAGAIHSARNVGTGRAAELATYIVEKGKPLLTVVK